MAEPSSGYGGYEATATATLPPPSVVPHYDLDPLETDTILTFNQTVEQVEASGGRDLSRYPAVTELYDKANGLRPKLTMSLDDTGKKQGARYPSPSLFRYGSQPMLT
jgi:growth factor-regulated tyrosine kinase substrate